MGNVRLVVATRNPAKVAAITRLVDTLADVASFPGDISQEPTTEPTATTIDQPTITHASIAQEKAVALSQALPGELVVATDGGLIVPALGSRWDPVRTRRFAGPDATDWDRANALLQLAAGLRGEGRSIWWEEALALARDGEVIATWTARSGPGLLAETVTPDEVARGGGFWIPAVWLIPEEGNRRLIELEPSDQDRYFDHWARLGEELRAFLRRYDADR